MLVHSRHRELPVSLLGQSPLCWACLRGPRHQRDLSESAYAAGPEPPAAVKPWATARDARSFGPGCMQPGDHAHNPDTPSLLAEDCTRLNVFTPAHAVSHPTQSKLPVLVWWHGGSFKEGSSFGPFNLYDGTTFVSSHNVIIVSCNLFILLGILFILKMFWLLTNLGKF